MALNNLSNIISNANGGATLDCNLNNVSFSTGYQVSIIDGFSVETNEEVEHALIELNKKHPLNNIGFWYNRETNLWDVDVSVTIYDLKEASDFAHQKIDGRGIQVGIWDWKNSCTLLYNEKTKLYDIVES